jgi:hypothetical protein
MLPPSLEPLICFAAAFITLKTRFVFAVRRVLGKCLYWPATFPLESKKRTVMNDITLAGALITSPASAFAELRERPRFWFPLLLLIATNVCFLLWYFLVVDIAWLRDYMFVTEPSLARIPVEMRPRVEAGFTRNRMMLGQSIFLIAVIPLSCALQALFYWIAAYVVGISLSFKHWFTLSAWCGLIVVTLCGLPSLLALMASAAYLVTQAAPMQVPPSEFQVLSLNELFFHIPYPEKGSFLMGSITLASFWTWALAVLCVRTWTNKSWLFSATFALLPGVLWYGVGAYLALN